jgi:hypothetical protein
MRERSRNKDLLQINCWILVCIILRNFQSSQLWNWVPWIVIISLHFGTIVGIQHNPFVHSAIIVEHLSNDRNFIKYWNNNDEKSRACLSKSCSLRAGRSTSRLIQRFVYRGWGVRRFCSRVELCKESHIFSFCWVSWKTL